MCPLFFSGVHGGYMGNLFNRCRRCVLYLVFLIPAFALAGNESVPASTGYTLGSTITVTSAFAVACSTDFQSAMSTFKGKSYPTQAAMYADLNTQKSSSMCHGTTNSTRGAPSLTSGNRVRVIWTLDGVGYSQEIMLPYTQAAACPDSSWTLDGTTCTRPLCEPGFDRGADGQCVKDCTGKRGQITVNNGYEFVGAVSNWSVGGCRVRCDQRVLASGGGMGYSCKFTGASASPDNPEAEALPPDPKELPPEEPNDCLAKGQGFIKSSTGKITCVPSSEAPAGNKPDKVESDKSKEIGKPGDDGYLKEEETNSSDSDGNTTTTKKETKNGTPDGNGGVTCPSGYVKNADNTCSKTTTEKQTTKGFCEENPNATVCKEAEKSVFGGGCESGFTCTGDAAQCAAARATWETRCMYREDATTPLHDAANPGGTPAQIDAAEKALNRDGSRSFDVGSEFSAKNNAYVGFSSTCPIADQTFAIARATVSVPASIICSIGAFIKLLIHIVAYMAVLRLFAFKLV